MRNPHGLHYIITQFKVAEAGEAMPATLNGGLMPHMKEIVVAALLTIGANVCLSAPAQAQCIPAVFPADWLQRQEAAGGHTIARFVGQSIQQLVARVFDSGMPAAGSYPGVPAAQATITSALSSDAIAINAWRNAGAAGGGPVNVGTTRAFEYANPVNIGTVAFALGNPPNAVGWGQTCAFRVVLRATQNNSCVLLASYPRPATPDDRCP